MEMADNARLVADLMMQFAGAHSHGGEHLIDVEGITRTDYLTALRTADRGDYALLLDFAKRA